MSGRLPQSNRSRTCPRSSRSTSPLIHVFWPSLPSGAVAEDWASVGDPRLKELLVVPSRTRRSVLLPRNELVLRITRALRIRSSFSFTCSMMTVALANALGRLMPLCVRRSPSPEPFRLFLFLKLSHYNRLGDSGRVGISHQVQSLRAATKMILAPKIRPLCCDSSLLSFDSQTILTGHISKRRALIALRLQAGRRDGKKESGKCSDRDTCEGPQDAR